MDLLKKLELWWKIKGTEKPHDDEINDVVSNEAEAAAAVSLPAEIIVEILLRIPSAKPLMRMKCVCKNWHSLIRDSKFATMHLTRHHHYHPSSSSLSILVFHDDKPVPMRVPEKAVFSVHYHGHDEGRLIQCYNAFPHAKLDTEQVVGSSNGIVCLFPHIPNLDKQDLIHLWNPETRELKRLPPNNLWSPPSPFYYNLFEFFYDPLMDDYKLLSVSSCNKFEYGVHMYSLASNSWRKIDDHAGINTSAEEMLWFRGMRSSGAVNGRYLHWIANMEHKNEITSEWCIVRFDLKREVFDRIIKPPPDLKTTCYQIRLRILDDCLTVVYWYDSDYVHNQIDIWVMKQYGVTASWTKLFAINHGIPLKIMELETSGKLVTLKIDEWSDSLVWFDLKSTNPFHATEIRAQCSFLSRVVSHVPTIFPIKAAKLH